MNRRSRLVVTVALMLATVVVGGACGGGGGDGGEDEAAEETTAIADEGDFIVEYEDAAAADAATEALVREGKVVEEAIDGLNEQYALPEDIVVTFTADDPDETGPYFDPNDNTVTFPFPYLTADRELFKGIGYETEEEIDAAVTADLLFTLYHELGHALVSVLDIPITGREEDSVDALAAVVLNETYEDGQEVVLSAADWFAAVSNATSDEDYTFKDFADEHSLDDQRYVTLLCLVYGSDPEGQADLVDPEVLPEERAERCEEEYDQARESWDELLAPYAKT